MRRLRASALLGLAACVSSEVSTRQTRPARDPLDLKNAMMSTTEFRQRVDACGGLGTRVVSYEEERSIGASSTVALLAKSKGVFVDAADAGATGRSALTTYVNVLGHRLAAYSARPTIGWTFVVFEDDTVKSFGAPGGYVGVSTGLLKATTDEAQLAGVLAREISYVALRTPLKVYIETKRLTCMASVSAQESLRDVDPALRSTLELMGASKEPHDLALTDAGFQLETSTASLLTTLVEKTASDVMTYSATALGLEADVAAVELMSFAGFEPQAFRDFVATTTPGATQRLKVLDQAIAAAPETQRATPKRDTTLDVLR